ncbi:MAG: formylmethanofuran dehydrogenase subunit E family protein [Candidatus Bathyarchaeia archaeon]|nr:formylmethanofuran dehydrogenase subunit E family protein [Candidatus Bathyarchaeota archaeon]
MFDDREALVLSIKNAENLHGHLGPFLVIGVKMAKLAMKELNASENKVLNMQIFAKLPLITPFSCVLDGIQATTHCTVGNRKLRVKSSDNDITVTFKLKGQDKTVKIRVKPQLVEELMSQLSKGIPNEKLAWMIAAKPEGELFEFQKR